MRLRCALALACLAGPAASGTFGLPQGCTGIVTVQMAECAISHFFTCTSDPAGYQREARLDAGGLIAIYAEDSEAAWVEAWYPDQNVTFRRSAPAEGPGQFTTLMNIGQIDFRYSFTDSLGTVVQVSGSKRLTHETTVIDGITLDLVAFDVGMSSPDGLWNRRSEGIELLHRDLRLYAGTAYRDTDASGTREVSLTPVTFTFPGEAGFLASAPTHGCDPTLSGAPAPAPFRG